MQAIQWNSTVNSSQRQAWKRAVARYEASKDELRVMKASFLSSASPVFLVRSRSLSDKRGFDVYHQVVVNEQGKFICDCAAHQHDRLQPVVCVHQVAAFMFERDR